MLQNRGTKKQFANINLGNFKFTNSLHDALLEKDPTTFWKSWSSKFNKSKRLPKLVDGLADPVRIANRFGEYFAEVCSGNSLVKNTQFMDLFQTEIQFYIGDKFDDSFLCTVESVDKVVNKLKRGKAACLDGLTSEHITSCHSIIITILVKLFNLTLCLCCN